MGAILCGEKMDQVKWKLNVNIYCDCDESVNTKKWKVNIELDSIVHYWVLRERMTASM